MIRKAKMTTRTFREVCAGALQILIRPATTHARAPANTQSKDNGPAAAIKAGRNPATDARFHKHPDEHHECTRQNP